MARIRTIKPGFFRSHDVTPLSYRARLTWVGLWTYVDDEGRGKDDARIIKGDIWTLEDDVSWQDVEADLVELARNDRIVRYVVDGRRYLAICRWDEHQVISRPTPSKFPEPTSENISAPASLTEESVSDPGANNAGKGRGTGNREGEREQETSPAVTKPDLDRLFDMAYESWPKKVERKEALERFKRAARKLDPEALAFTITRFGNAYADTTERQFIPALGVWLNGERWTDELPQPREPERKASNAQKALSVVEHFAQQEQGALGA